MSMARARRASSLSGRAVARGDLGASVATVEGRITGAGDGATASSAGAAGKVALADVRGLAGRGGSIKTGVETVLVDGAGSEAELVSGFGGAKVLGKVLAPVGAAPSAAMPATTETGWLPSSAMSQWDQAYAAAPTPQPIKTSPSNLAMSRYSLSQPPPIAAPPHASKSHHAR
jgi:hypothetical protein